MVEPDKGKYEPLALFGGTFDPVHYGHLRCADEARRALRLDSLSLLPSGRPPHRAAPGATAQQRLDMLRLAVDEFPALEIDDRELRRNGPSYMVDTLEALRASHARRPLLMLLGQDAANLLHGWHRWRELFSLTHIVILSRPEARAEYHPAVEREIEQRLTKDLRVLERVPAGGVVNLSVPAIEISATGITDMIRDGISPRGLLPDPVLDYIVRGGLYLECNGFTPPAPAAKIADTSNR